MERFIYKTLGKSSAICCQLDAVEYCNVRMFRVKDVRVVPSFRPEPCRSTELNPATKLLWMCFLSYTFYMLHDQMQRSSGIDLQNVIMAGVQSALVVVNLVFAVVLTVGAFKKRSSLMWPWIVMAWVSGLFTFITQLVSVVSAYNHQRVYWLHGVEMLLSTLYPVVMLYASCVVNARRRQMVAEYYASPVRFSRTNSYEKRVYVPVTTYQYND